MAGGLIGKRSHVQSPQHDVSATLPVMIGDSIGAESRCDVDLDDDQVRRIVELQFLDMFVRDRDLIFRWQIPGERGQT